MSTPSKPNIRVRPKATDGTLEFWWGPPTSDGGSAVTGYVFNIPGVVTHTLGPTDGYYKVTGLVNGDPYTATIYATNANGNGATATFRTVEPGNLPGPMNTVTTTRDASGVATFSWTAPTSDGGATIGWNKLSLIPLRSDLPTKFYNTVAADTSITVTDLSADESYIALVQARNDPGFPILKQVLTRTLTFGTMPQDISGFRYNIDAGDLNSLYVDTSGQTLVGYESAVSMNSWVSQNLGFTNIFPTWARFIKNGIRNGTGPYYPTISFNSDSNQYFQTFNPVILSSRNEVSLYFYFEITNTLIDNQYVFSAYSNNISISLDTSRGTNLLFYCDAPGGISLPYSSGGPVLAGMYADLSNVIFEVYHPVNQTLLTTTRQNVANFTLPDTMYLAQNAKGVRISEIAMFNHVLTGTNKANILSYFGKKWGFITLPPPIVYFVAAYLGDGETTWNDRSGNGWIATLTGGTSAKDGTNALALDGASYWSFGDIGVQTNFSVSVWFKRTGASDPGGSIVTEVYAGTPVNIAIIGGQYGPSSTEFAGGFFDGAGWRLSTPQTFALNTWKQMTTTWDGTNLKTYINGALVDTVNYSAYTATSSGLGYRIGRRWDNADYVTGSLGELRIDSTALTPEQVLYYYNNTSAIYPNSPWTERTSAGLGDWWVVASSSDGTKLAAAVGNVSGRIYTSTDSGETWTERNDVSGNWWGLISSDDGTKLAAASYGNYIYTSSNSGATWTQRTASGARNWYSLAASANASILVAVVPFDYIYTSSDYGVTWTQQTSAGTANWVGVACSSDGTIMYAIEYGGYIWVSTDSGSTWTNNSGASGSANWRAITCSYDGTKVAAAVYGGYIYTSTNSGTTWTERTASGISTWQSITSSADGTKLAAVQYGGSIYISTNSGVTWTAQSDPGIKNWSNIRSSYGGNKLIASAYGDRLWTYTST